MEVGRKMSNILGVGVAERDDYNLMKFEETELRLGLPGGGGGDPVGETAGGGGAGKNSGKRGFSETIDLKLKLPASKELISHDMDRTSEKVMSSPKEKNLLPATDPAKPSAPKAQVVGWPPVRAFRKNILSVHQKNGEEKEKEKDKGSISNGSSGAAAFVKVSMDGAPYLRKVDLKMYKSYQDLSDALAKMFSSFTIGSCGSQGMKDFMNESKLMDLLNGSEYVPTYEDKDGDWMLVGDVPWDMFVESCKRLRIMKGSEAIGLAPRAVEKCKNRS